jgi:hypothetical protein
MRKGNKQGRLFNSNDFFPHETFGGEKKIHPYKSKVANY